MVSERGVFGHLMPWWLLLLGVVLVGCPEFPDPPCQCTETEICEAGRCIPGPVGGSNVPSASDQMTPDIPGNTVSDDGGGSPNLILT